MGFCGTVRVSVAHPDTRPSGAVARTRASMACPGPGSVNGLSLPPIPAMQSALTHASAVVPGGQSAPAPHASRAICPACADSASSALSANPIDLLNVPPLPRLHQRPELRVRAIEAIHLLPACLHAFLQPRGDFRVKIDMPSREKQRLLFRCPQRIFPRHHGPTRMIVAEKPPGIGGVVGGTGDAPTAIQCPACEQSGVTSAPFLFCGHISSIDPGAAV